MHNRLHAAPMDALHLIQCMLLICTVMVLLSSLIQNGEPFSVLESTIKAAYHTSRAIVVYCLGLSDCIPLAHADPNVLLASCLVLRVVWLLQFPTSF